MKRNSLITILSVIVLLFCFNQQTEAAEDGNDDLELNDDQKQDSSNSEENVESRYDKESKSKDPSSNENSKESTESEKSNDSKEEDKKEETEDNTDSSSQDSKINSDEQSDNSSESDDEKKENEDTDPDSSTKDDNIEESENNSKVEEESSDSELYSVSSLRKGDKGNEVKTLQKNLTELGFVVKITSSFDNKTKNQVKEFQRYYQLDVDGIVGQNTFAKLDEILDSPLQKGKNSKSVIPFKKKLNQMGYDGIAISNVFGPHTERRVKEFQSDQGLPVSGILEENTQSKINTLYKKKEFSEGDRHPDITKLKRNLNQLGFDGLAIADLYGSFTTKRVKEFQEYYGLKATGNANSNTFDKIDEILSSSLQKGNSTSSVIPFKKKLNQMGYDGIAISNVFGPHTERRVKEFQSDQGLPVSGILEENTQSKINTLYEKKEFSEGDRHPDITKLKRNLNQLGFDGLAIADLYGSFTTKRVKEFQEYYGLKATGNANSNTFDKIDEILSSSLQKGNSTSSVIPFKKKLNRMEYDGIAISEVFGPHTERRVKQFQADNNLPVSGILEKNTQDKIDDYFSDIFSKGGRHAGVIKLKRNLNRLGFDGLAIADLYGSFTTKRVKEFQEYYGLKSTGKANLATLEKIDEVLSSPLQKGKSNKETLELKKDLNKLGYNGLALAKKYGAFTEKRVKQLQADHDLSVSGIADEVTLAKIKELLKTNTYTKYDITLDKATDKQMKTEPQTDKKQAWVSKKYIKNGKVTASELNVRKGPGTPYNTVGSLKKGNKVTILDQMNGWYSIKYDHSEQWVHANSKDVKYHLDPNNFIDDSKQKFQFLDLSKRSGASKNLLDDYLKGKGTLDGQGQAFIDAGKQQGVNDVYLISHALLETGNGTSKLASGVEVGKNKSGKPVLVTKKNRKKLKNIKKVYNMFGVHAFDDCALECGAKKAYKEGWTTPAKAIKGGSSFIGNSYIKKEQNTIYQMRWNPVAMESGAPSHQYATDIGWATKQVDTMYNLYQSMKIKDLYLDIPEYK